MRYNRITIFCDYGLDDAIATLHILKHAEMFEHIDVVPVGGNVTVDTAYRNAHTLLATASVRSEKVRIVDTRGIEQSAADIPDVHGADGIGDVLKPALSDMPVTTFDKYKAELDRTADKAHDCILSLGPCTVPVLLGYYPDTIALMGGTTRERPNYGEYEFNEGMDAAAFKALAEMATAVATLDSCHDDKFGFESYDFNDALTDKLFEKYKALCKARDAYVTVYDYVAALYVTNPEMFVLKRVERADGVKYNEMKLS